MTLRRKLQFLLLAPVEGETPPAGGAAPVGEKPAGEATPDSGSADDNGEAPEPVVDEFLKDALEKPDEDQPPAAAPKVDEPAPAPAATPAAPAAAPSTPAPVAPSPAPADGQPPAQPATPAATPPAQPPAAATPPAPPAAAPATPPAQPVVPPAQPSAEETARLQQEQRNAYLAQVEKEFEIPEAEHDTLLAEPHKILPKLAARVHVAAVEATIGLIRQNFPNMVHAVLEQQKAAASAEQQFYSKWPKLATPEAKAEANRLMTNYLAVNKNVTREQAINDVGLLVHASLRIPLDVPGAPPASPAAGAPPSAPPPPAQPGAAGGTPLVRTPTVWDKVDQELFTDDT